MKYLLALVCCSTAALGQIPYRVQLEPVASLIASPVDIQSPRDGSGRLFLVQQNGVIRILKNGTLLDTPFLDIRSRLSFGGEQGLLGLAFPPFFAQKGWFYVNYTNRSGSTTISRFLLNPFNPDAADAASERILLTIPQPFANHNGGQLQFGPDGMLYIGMGDGGGANDPQGNGQNRLSLLGKMLRIDTESNLARYEIPATNPFAANPTYAPEIWALGLRNPWRFSFDSATGGLYIADVGQDRFEEIDFQPATSKGGENYGWSTMEGSSCLASTCDRAGLTLPLWTYAHPLGLSITGGYVYRGSRYPSLAGIYLFGDYVTGKIWGLRNLGKAASVDLLADFGASFAISTFGQDQDGELYIANYKTGEIFRLQFVPQPAFTANGVVNAASFETALVPGSLATLFTVGLLDSNTSLVANALPLPRSLNGYRLAINGADVPLWSIVRNGDLEQISFQVPWELQPGATARLQLFSPTASSSIVDVPVSRPKPGIFGINATDALLIRSSDFTLVAPGAPLARNEVYTLYATGLGLLNLPVANGQAFAAASPVRGTAVLRIGAATAELLYAGSAPGFVGVYQVNFRPGPAAASGPQDLVLSLDGTNSPSRKIVIAP